MIFREQFPQQAEMNELERTFKALWEKHPGMGLHLPHSQDYNAKILRLAGEQASEYFLGILPGATQEEEDFFRDNSDAELYRQIRYLPAILHSHAFLEIVCILEGECTNYIQRQSLPMRKGDICMIAPGIDHAISAFSDDCILINIILRTSTFEKAFFGLLSENDILSDFFRHSLYRSRTHPYLFFRAGDDQELFNFVLCAYEEFLEERPYWERMLNNILSAFFILLLRNHSCDMILPSVTAGGSDENVGLILNYLQEHLSTVTLCSLAGLFNYSERQIQRIMKKSTGMSFRENVQKLKMNRAARLFLDSDRPVSEIAAELGYSDAGSFRRTFKKYFGNTPAEYRDSLLNSQGNDAPSEILSH